MYKTKTITILLWIARIWGSVIFAFVLFFLIAHLFGNEESSDNPISIKDKITFVLFPLGTIIGLAVALKWEGLGGFIASLSLLILFAIRVDLVQSIIFPIGIFPPGLLYLVYWFLQKKWNLEPIST